MRRGRWYESRGAYEAHVASPHYEGIAVAQIRPLLSDRIVEFCQVIAAEDSG
jgi:quinol monooxygenase YgiN